MQGRLEGLIDGVYPRDASQLEPLLDDIAVLARLVDDLRTLANAESGVLTLEREATDIGMLCATRRRAVRTARRRSRCDQGLRTRRQRRSVLIQVRIRQVLVNLLANAIRTAAGGAGSAALAS